MIIDIHIQPVVYHYIHKIGNLEEEAVPITVSVNGMPVTMTGKASYVFVDVFDYIDFDLSKPQGARVVTKRNAAASWEILIGLNVKSLTIILTFRPAPLPFAE